MSAWRRALLALAFIGAAGAAAASPTGPDFILQANPAAADSGPNDAFGSAVAIDGDTAVVSARDKNNVQGAVYVFVRSGTVWTQQQKLTAGDPVNGDDFGSSLALSGNTVVIGAPDKNGDQGAAYVFTRSGAVWTQQAKLTASDAASADLFGNSVGISGETVVVGALLKAHTGAAYVFTRSGVSWSQQAKLTASDATNGDSFGDAVAISGDTAVIGAEGRSFFTGLAYVFTRTGGVWTQQQQLVPSDPAGSSVFGSAVAVEGDTALIGAQGKHGGAGAAYVFARAGGVWTQQQELGADDAAANDFFGGTLSLSGNTAVVGAGNKNNGQGAAYVFTGFGPFWNQKQKLFETDGVANDSYGFSVAVSGNTAIVGAEERNAFRGAAYVYYSNPPDSVPVLTPWTLAGLAGLMVGAGLLLLTRRTGLRA